MSDIVEIEAHRNRAQAAYDKLPLSGPVVEWCEMYGEDLLDSCTKLLAHLKQRTDLIDAAAKHWLESCRVTSPPIPWEGAIDGAMEAACREIKRLRAENAKLEKMLAEANDEADVREGDTLVGQIKMYVQHRHDLASQNITLRKRVTELEAENAKLREGIAAVEALIADSHGVVGLHLNGDIASWVHLRKGGYMEEWLVAFDRALPESPR